MLEGEQKTIARSVKKKRRAPTVASQKKKLLVLSAVSALSVIIISFIISSVVGNTTIRDMGAVAGIIAGVMPIVTVNMRQVHRKGSIDKNLPIFLLGLRSSVVSGHSIIQGISEAANRKMGALTPELKNLRANLSWGMPVEEAFNNFVEVIQKHVSEMENLENERKSTMRPYIFTIYISFAVFLSIVAILVFQFFTEIEKLQVSLASSGGVQGAGLFGGLMDVSIDELNKLMLHMSIVESIFGGLAAGKIGEGSFVAGVKHVVILIALSVIVFAMIGAV